MQRILILFLFFGLTMAACKDKATSDNTEQAPAMEMADPAAQGTPAAAPDVTGVSNPNPPHGQPGHRCDIPVGASLDNAPPKPAGTPSPVFQNDPASSTPLNTQPSGTTQVAPGTNPPHGQPGHRCDIPVGAPLNSPAGQ